MLYINGFEVFEGRFPDNTFHINKFDCEYLRIASTKQNSDGYDSHFYAMENDNSACITWKYEKPEELFMLQCIVMHLRDRFNMKDISLVMPYAPNARMDRTKDALGEINILKYFCRLINDMKFSMVLICDPHSDAVVNQLDHCIVYYMDNFIHDIVTGDTGGESFDYIFFPDEGAAKRYGGIYTFRPHFVGEKVRDWSTGKIIGYEIKNQPAMLGDIADKKVLIVDDICSRGGTFTHAVNALLQIGFKHISLAVTHLENTVFAGPLLRGPIERIYCTDSLKHSEHDKIITVKLTTF